MGLFNVFKKKKKTKDFKDLLDLMSPKEDVKETYKEITEYHYKRTDGEFLFKIGDKVICRSNEADPLLIGEIVSFWDNEGRWTDPIPYVKDSNDNLFGVMGIIRPYSEELLKKLNKMKPLEQWNYFVPQEYQYSKEEMLRKEDLYRKRKEFLDKNFAK
jgi:hypothetical protein